MVTRARGTMLGFFGILGWSIYAVLVATANQTPRLLFVAILLTVSAMTLCVNRLLRRESFAELMRIPLSTLALGVMGLAASNFLQVVAFGSGASPYAVAVVSFAWPIMMVGILVLMRVAVPSALDWLGLGFGFAGVSAVTLEDGSFSFHIGLAYALLASLAWAAYSALRTLVPAGPRDSMLAFAVVSATMAWALHFASSEPTAAPWNELAMILLLGIIPVGLSNLLWDIGARYGDPVTLAGLCYLEPILSMGLLIVFLDRHATRFDLAGLALVVLGGIAIMIGDRHRRRAEALQAQGNPA